MINDDTIKLLRECDAGIRMGIDILEEMLKYTKNMNESDCMYRTLEISRDLEKDTTELLKEYHDDGKNPNPIAEGMSWMKTNVKIALNDSDHTIADLVTEGCNMGIKSLQKYLNEFKAADEKSKTIAQKLIDSEDHLIQDMRAYL